MSEKYYFALLFRPLPPSEDGKNKLTQIFVYLLKITEISDSDYTLLFEELNENVKSEVMSSYEMIMQKGEARGMKKVEKEKKKREQAEQAKKQAELKLLQIQQTNVLKMHAKGFPIEVIMDLLTVKKAFVKQTIAEHQAKKK